MKKTLIIAAIALIITAGTVSLVDAQMKDRVNKPELTAEMEVEREAHRAEMKAQREEMQNIMETGTFEEWKALVESRPRMTDYITTDNFAKFQEAHKLKQAGDLEGAKKIMDELGIEGKIGMMGVKKGGFNRGMFKMNGECPFQK